MSRRGTIAALLAEHRAWPGRGLCRAEGCHWDWREPNTHDEHVAEVIDQALGQDEGDDREALARAIAVVCSGIDQPIPGDYGIADAVLAAGFRRHPETTPAEPDAGPLREAVCSETVSTPSAGVPEGTTVTEWGVRDETGRVAHSSQEVATSVHEGGWTLSGVPIVAGLRRERTSCNDVVSEWVEVTDA